jgi:hypothetical protein
MRRLILACAVFTALVVPIGATSVHADNGNNNCPPGQYKKLGKCVPGSSAGTFTIALAGTQVKLTGKSSRATRHTPVTINRVTVSGVRAHSQAFRVFAPGTMPALHLVPKGTLYRFNVSTNTWTRVSTITGSGIYQAVFR